MKNFANVSSMPIAPPATDDAEEPSTSPFKFTLLEHTGFDFAPKAFAAANSWSGHARDRERPDEEEATNAEDLADVRPVPVGDDPNGAHGVSFEQIDDLRECITAFRNEMRDVFRDYCENPTEFDFRTGLSEAIDHLHDCLDAWREDWFANASWKQSIHANDAGLI